MNKYIFIPLICFMLSYLSEAQNWQTDFNQAKAIASKNNQNIVLVFQGSDWCAPCIKLDKEIWSTQEFIKLSENHFVMLQADFPRKKANKLSEVLTTQNAFLAETYNEQGYFPFVVVLDKNGNVLGKMGYEKITPEAYYKKLTAFEI